MPVDVAVRAFDKTVQRHQVPHDQPGHRIPPLTDCILQLVAEWQNRCNNASGLFEGCAMGDDMRSGCPINLSLEVVGDRWSLLVIRDMMFGNRRYFRELLTKSK